jgi:hypothetical protein
VNTVLWNTIQLLFPREVEARKAAGALNCREASAGCQIPETAFYNNLRNRSARDTSVGRRRENALSQDEDAALAQRPQRTSGVSSRDTSVRRRRRRENELNQDEDAALALRLQRDEFMEAFRGTNEQQSRSSLSLARENLRAMATRAVNLRIRGRHM